MANIHTTLTSLFDDIADAIRENKSITEQIKADVFPAYIRILGYNGTVSSTPSVLNSCSWDFIRWASDEGIADLLWDVGDRKSVTLNQWGPTLSGYQVNGGTYYCYILGFNHNSSIEGNNRIHFEFGFDALSGGNHIAFCGTDYGLQWDGDNNPYYTRMNTTETNSGGWKSSTMRTGTLNGTTRSFRSACPSELLSVIKATTKYTDNVANGSSSVKENVTATSDNFFITNTVEVMGTTQNSNTYESSYTKQYQYFKNGNSYVHKRSNSLSNNGIVNGRSPYVGNNKKFIGRGGVAGTIGTPTADNCYCVAPAFCV